ncbi:MarR family transcriptional regulator [Corynebacterium sp.]|uniref:MarR family winged helix-turn-helix transcriptional regulator n=1 Tax=Corynebacterium sp. TaxID=1720 RepID=UPI0028B0AC76|nr:MarR family transcriptional regulator [Corynebacterium sp.]
MNPKKNLSGEGAESQTRWLNDEEKDTFFTLMALIIEVDRSLDKQLNRNAGLSHFGYTALARLSEAENRQLRMSELASTANGSLSRLSQVIAKLEKKGWVTRSADPEDGRYTVATLTDAGYDKVVETAPGHVEQVQKVLFDPLTKSQVQQIHIIGQRILRRIKELDSE